MENKVILVNEDDAPIGEEEKMAAHKKGLQHRAFSIFVFNSANELMLQQRAINKYHSGGLWTNTCCSHPSPGEKTELAAHRRLKEEMGFDCPLSEAFVFAYRAELGDLTENEIDHVFVGTCDDSPEPNPEEAEDWRWVSTDELEKEIENNPQSFTYWFKDAWPRLKQFREQKED
ncbi:MAG: isopentenyl-diphosphate Delta-isomerase [Patescibacteria group bacterium]|jgi:isopentenyl-diphosphate delta-isomerase